MLNLNEFKQKFFKIFSKEKEKENENVKENEKEILNAIFFSDDEINKLENVVISFEDLRSFVLLSDYSNLFDDNDIFSIDTVLEHLRKRNQNSISSDFLKDYKNFSNDLIFSSQAQSISSKDAFILANRFCSIVKRLLAATPNTTTQTLISEPNNPPEQEDNNDDQPSNSREGNSAYEPVNVINSFHSGNLYYPVDTVETKLSLNNETGKFEPLEMKRTVVVRSDGELLKAFPSELPPDALTGDRIYRLTDGTLIQQPPKASNYSTWDWDSIQEFVESPEQHKPLKDLLHEVHAHLYSRIWLPNECDYWILALGVATSYCQSIFDAVPLILLTGKAGTGKSEISTAMTEISANAVMVSQASAASIMRLGDESGGLLVVDDLEAIGTKRGQDRFNEVGQVLKTSYKKSSASRIITDKGGRTRIMRYFGIKIVSNTTGVDKIIGSRMLHVYTQYMPDGELADFKKRAGVSSNRYSSLKNDLHTWAFSNTNAINDLYTSIYKIQTKRDDEIAAPLRVLAELSGDAEIQQALELALSTQDERKTDTSDHEDLLIRALHNITSSGNIKPSIQQTILEIRRILTADGNLVRATPVSWLTPEWVGRHIKSMDLLEDGSKPTKMNIRGYQSRYLKLSTEALGRLNVNPDQINRRMKPSSFCSECSGCNYENVKCEIREKIIANSNVA